jgi:hypothetical protein
MPKDASLYDKFAKGIADAVADIREKVVEEPMYGRALSERDAGPQGPQAQEQETSFGGITRTIDVGPTRDQLQDNANYRLAAMERELNPQWPKAGGHAQEIAQERDRDADREMDR